MEKLLATFRKKFLQKTVNGLTVSEAKVLLNQRSMITLSTQRALPSMLCLMLEVFRCSVYLSFVS